MKSITITNESTLPKSQELDRFTSGHYLFQVKQTYTVMSANQDNEMIIFDEQGISDAIKDYHKWASENRYYQDLYYVGF